MPCRVLRARRQCSPTWQRSADFGCSASLRWQVPGAAVYPMQTENAVEDHVPTCQYCSTALWPARSRVCVVVSLFEGPDRATQRPSISTLRAQDGRTFSTVVLCQQQQVATVLRSLQCRQTSATVTTRAQEPSLAGPRGWPTRTRVAAAMKRMERKQAGLRPVIDPGTVADWSSAPRTWAIARLPRRQVC